MFTYIGKETTYITEIFEHTNLKIAHRTNNSVQEHLIPILRISKKFSASGVYKHVQIVGKTSIGQSDKTFPRDTQNIYTLSEVTVALQDLPSISMVTCIYMDPKKTLFKFQTTRKNVHT
jgi:hypothetical protein